MRDAWLFQRAALGSLSALIVACGGAGTAAGDSKDTAADDSTALQSQTLKSGLLIVNAVASNSDENVANNAIDLNAATRWSGQGSGTTLTIELEQRSAVTSLSVEWYRASSRTSMFDVAVSEDGIAFHTVVSKRSSSKGVAIETYDLGSAQAKFVRVVGYGNSENDWNSIVDVSVAGTPAPSAPPPSDGGHAPGLDPNVSPGGNFDLAHYYLTLPIGSAGTPTTIQGASLEGNAGYHSDYFYTAADGAMTFWSPLTNVTTSTSDHPRTELREQLIPGNNASTWRVRAFATNALRATVAVGQIPPTTGDVGIGQIHENGGANKPFVLLHYTKGQLHAKVLRSESGSDYTDLVFSHVALNTKLTYELKTTSDGTLTITINGATQTLPIDPSWMNVDLYFKAGVYCLDSGVSSTNGCRASFYVLDRTHS